MEFSPHHRKNRAKGGNCCVANCDSKERVNRQLSFHKVPMKGSRNVKRVNAFGNSEIVDKREEWLRRLNVTDSGKHLIVCSLHFRETDYLFPDAYAKLRKLKENALPVNVNLTKLKETANKHRQERKNQRAIRKQAHKNTYKKKRSKNKACDPVSSTLNSNFDSSRIMTQNQESANIEGLIAQEDHDSRIMTQNQESADIEGLTAQEDHDSDCEARFLELAKEPEVCVSENVNNEVDDNNSAVKIQKSLEKKYVDKGVQVNTSIFTVSFPMFIQSEKDLITMCNIKSFDILNELCKLMDEIYPKKKKCSMTTRDSIILVTAKLKLDISFSGLAVLFKQVCHVTIRNIFYDTLKKLGSILQCVVTRVSKEEIQRNMPKCFSKFSSTTSVLDCIEVKVQTPKCLKCRIKFYSHYKGGSTVKFMTEVTPAGLITFVSKSFGGRASDKTIFNHSQVLQYLKSTRDSVMVDKGFLIDEECAQRRVNVIRPLFLKNRKQLSEDEALRNREIACARVHIERMNQRIKQFEILNHKIPWHFIDYVDDIFIICCGLANLGTPILDDDKF